jgi:hypothetical protein
MDYALGNNHAPRIVDPENHFHAVVIRRTLWTIIPKRQFEVPRPHPAEEVRLIHVLVGTAQDSGLGHAEIGHGGMELRLEFVVAEQLRQPAAFVDELAQGTYLHAFDGSFGEHQIFLAISGKGMASFKASSLA